MVSIYDLAEALKKAIDIFSVLAGPKSTSEQRAESRKIFEFHSPLCAFALKAREQVSSESCEFAFALKVHASSEGQICDYCPMAYGWKNGGEVCYQEDSIYSRYVLADNREEAMHHASAMLTEAQHRFKAVSKVALSNEKP